jgi:hypothetical protein
MICRVLAINLVKPGTRTTQNTHPHDKKYTTHSKENNSQSQRHILEDKKKYTYKLKNSNNIIREYQQKIKKQQRTPDDTHHLQYSTNNTEFYTETTREFAN